MTILQKKVGGRFAATILAVAMTVGGSAFAGDCMRFDAKTERATGDLGIGAFQDAADRPESAFILSLTVPTCLDADDPEFRVKNAGTIHIFAVDEATQAQIEQLAGKAVIVRGRPFGAHTSHHHAPIVMEITDIEAR